MNVGKRISTKVTGGQHFSLGERSLDKVSEAHIYRRPVAKQGRQAASENVAEPWAVVE